MKRIYKIILIGASILIIILGVLFWLFIRSVGEIDIPSTLNEAVVDFDELNEKVYFRAKAWGLLFQHPFLHDDMAIFLNKEQHVQIHARLQPPCDLDFHFH
jgi:hypothetical protein